MRAANGTGTIYKAKGKRRKPFIVKSPAFKNSEGKYKSFTLGSFATRKEAQEFLFKYNLKNLKVENNKITLGNFFDLYKESDSAKSIKTQAVFDRYVSLFEKFFKSLKDKPLINLKYIDFQAILDRTNNTNGRNLIFLLKWIYNEALKREVVDKDISRFLKPSIYKSRTVKRLVFSDEFVRFLEKEYLKNEDSYCAMIIILFYTGMRKKDLKNLLNENIFLDERYIITGSKTIAGMNRKIPIHNKIITLFEKYKSKKYKHFFRGSEAKLNLKFKKYIFEFKKDDIGNLHSIRHTFITKMQKLKNVKVSMIKTIVGHSFDNVTDGVYTHYSTEDLVAIINKLEY